MRNKDWRLWLLLAVFSVSLAAIGYLAARQAANRTAEAAADEPVIRFDSQYIPSASLELGPVEVRDYRRMGSIRGQLKYSPDSSRLLVGTDNGDIIMLDTANSAVVWRWQIGIGKISAVAFAHDGDSVYVGETSPDGNIYCLDSVTGRELWRYSTALELGADLRRKSYPAVMKIAALSDRVVFLAMRYAAGPDKRNSYMSRLYAATVDGALDWRFPAVGNMDAWVSWFGVDSRGRNIAFATANYMDIDYEFDKTLYSIDGGTGRCQWSSLIEPAETARRTVMRGSPNVSADGKFIASLASDGRAFMHDETGALLWRRDLSKPKEINGVVINSVGRDAYIIGDNVVFATLNTFNSANWQLPAPLDHPSSNSVFIFGLNGDFRGRWQAGGSVEQMDFTSSSIAVAVGRNTKTKDTSIHGIYILDMDDALKPVGVLSAAGPVTAAAISPDAAHTAGIEVPLKLDDGTILGRHRLIIGRRR